jgi:hypothetical protein
MRYRQHSQRTSASAVILARSTRAAVPGRSGFRILSNAAPDVLLDVPLDVAATIQNPTSESGVRAAVAGGTLPLNCARTASAPFRVLVGGQQLLKFGHCLPRAADSGG